MTNYYLGIDCGGTFIKAALFDQTGKMHTCERENVEVISEHAGYAERDMHSLWQACATLIYRTMQTARIEPTQIKSIGISAQGKGVFLLDKYDQPLGRAILSSDQRALAIVKQWKEQGIEDKVYPLSHQSLWTGHPVSVLRWLKEHEPERYGQINTVFMTHDFLRFCLTGERYCEESNISESNLYHMEKGRYEPELAALLGIAEIVNKLPPIVKSIRIAGYVTEQAAKLCGLAAGTPVVGGVFDVTAMTLAMNDRHDNNKLNVMLGTWSIVTGISDHIDYTQKTRFSYGRYIEANKFLIQEASPTSAGNLEWFIKQWKLNYQQVNQMVAQLPPAQSAVLFLPFLYGSNTSLGMTAGFYGMQSHHTLGNLLQAVYEGVLFSLTDHLERMYQYFPHIERLRVAGGITKSAIWLQMLADLSGKVLEVPEIEEEGCLGAAIVAAEGVQDDSGMMQRQSIAVVQPNPALFMAYQKKYQKYKALIQALAQL
ncbi:FGGY-family carbohydrate kinase [Pasteurellaceae bacterium LIM206]|nr:FGGY-family carbohydrate kinase [Pasteurellaceae bacterium LIM206]